MCTWNKSECKCMFLRRPQTYTHTFVCVANCVVHVSFAQSLTALKYRARYRFQPLRNKIPRSNYLMLDSNGGPAAVTCIAQTAGWMVGGLSTARVFIEKSRCICACAKTLWYSYFWRWYDQAHANISASTEVETYTQVCLIPTDTY